MTDITKLEPKIEPPSNGYSRAANIAGSAAQYVMDLETKIKEQTETINRLEADIRVARSINDQLKLDLNAAASERDYYKGRNVEIVTDLKTVSNILVGLYQSGRPEYAPKTDEEKGLKEVQGEIPGFLKTGPQDEK